MLPVSSRAAFRLALVAILLFGSAPAAWSDERLDVYPLLSLSEEFTDNFPETLVNPAFSPPVLAPLPPGVSPPPVNSPPIRPSPSTKGSNYDAISTAIGGATFDLTGPSRTLELDYLTDGELYAQNSNRDRALQDHYVGLRDTERMGETTNFWLSDTFIKGQPVFGQALIGPAATTPLLAQALLQDNFTTNSFAAGLSHNFNPKLSLELGAHQNFFLATSGASSESFLQVGTAHLYYSISPELAVGPSYEFYDSRFSNAPRQDAHEPGLSARWNPDPRWSVSGTVGPLLITSARGIKYDVGFRFEASYTLERAIFSVRAGRSPSTTVGVSGAAVGQYFGGSAAYEIAKRTDVYVFGSYFDASGSGVSQSIISYGGGLSRQLNKNAAFFVQYIGFRTNASTTSRALTNNVLIGLKLTGNPWSWTF